MLAVYGIGYDKDILPDKQGLVFAKVDTNGQVHDYRIFHDSLGDDYTMLPPGSFIKLQNGSGYALMAQLFSRLNGIILVLDNDGYPISLAEFSDTISKARLYYKLLETNTSFYLSGMKERPNNKIELFVSRVDKKGNQIWEKFYGASNREVSIDDIIKINENELVIGSGTTSLFGIPPSKEQYTSKIFAIDSLSNIKWTWESLQSKEEGGAGSLYKSPEGYWHYKSFRCEYNAAKNESYVQPKFIKRDSNFNLVFEKTVGVPNSLYNRFYYAAPMQNGDWLAAGSVLKDEKTLAGWMYRLSSAGDSLWSRMDTAQASGPIFAENYLYSAAELPSGSIVACGYSQRFDEPTFWGWLIKVDQNGCIDTLSCTPMSSTQVEKLAGRLKLYPNPAQALVHFADEDQIVWDRIEVVDAAGQVLSTLIKPTGNEIDLSSLGPGAYFIRFLKSDKYVVKPVIKP